MIRCVWGSCCFGGQRLYQLSHLTFPLVESSVQRLRGLNQRPHLRSWGYRTPGQALPCLSHVQKQFLKQCFSIRPGCPQSQRSSYLCLHAPPPWNFWVTDLKHIPCACLGPGVRASGTGVTNVCELPCGGWKLNLGHLKEKPVFLTTQPVLQPLQSILGNTSWSRNM